MSFRPNPRQALFLWRMITGSTPEQREPELSAASLSDAEVEELVRHGLLAKEQRNSGGARAQHLLLAEHAWDWAAAAGDVELSHSAEAASVLEGLLRRLLPFLRARNISLAELFDANKAVRIELDLGYSIPVGERVTCPGALRPDPDDVDARILRIAAELVRGKAVEPIRLATLRAQLPGVSRTMVDEALLRLVAAHQIELEPKDDGELSDADRAAALRVGDTPNTLLRLKG